MRPLREALKEESDQWARQCLEQGTVFVFAAENWSPGASIKSEAVLRLISRASSDRLDFRFWEYLALIPSNNKDGFFWRPAKSRLEQYVGIKWCEVLLYDMDHAKDRAACKFLPDIVALSLQINKMRQTW